MVYQYLLAWIGTLSTFVAVGELASMWAALIILIEVSSSGSCYFAGLQLQEANTTGLLYLHLPLQEDS